MIDVAAQPNVSGHFTTAVRFAARRLPIRAVGRWIMCRKNDSAPGARATNEIVEEIVVNLRPWKRGNTADAITAAVNRQLDALLKLAPLEAKLSDRTRNRAHAEKLDGALSEVETLLASAPDLLSWSLFDPLPPLTLTKDGELRQVIPSIESIELSYRARADSFFAELKQLRKVCASAVDRAIRESW
jgi:hypothetical protein